MAKVHGRSPLPLPESLTSALEDLGYREMPYDKGGVVLYRTHLNPELFFTAVRSNVPGSADVVAGWKGQSPVRMPVDAVVERLRAQILLVGASQRMSA